MGTIFPKSSLHYQQNRMTTGDLIHSMQTRETEYKKLLIVVAFLVVLIVGVMMIRVTQKPSQRDETGVTPQSLEENTPLPTSETELWGEYRLEPQTVKSSPGAVFTIKTVLVAPKIALDGADIILRFDPEFLTVEGITPSSLFSAYPRKEIDNTVGSVHLTGFTSSTTLGNKGETVADIAFRANKVGTTTITVDFQKNASNRSTIVEKGTSKNVLGSVKGATVQINPASL